MNWTFYKGQEVFERYQEQWDKLNATIDNHVLLDSKFWGALVQFFSNEKTLLGISESREYPGMVLVENVGLGMWSTFQPSQAPIGPILLGNPANIEAQMRGILTSLPGYALGLGVTQQDPSFGHFHTLETHQTVEMKSYMKTARIHIEGDFERYWEARKNDVRSTVRKRLRRLEREGIGVSIDVHRAPEDMQRCIQHYGNLEESGWKGREGTAVTSENIQGKFYRHLLEKMCLAGEGEIYSLRFNDKTVAQKICLRRNGMIVFLKMAYDETYRHLSPGYILQYEILKRLFRDTKIACVETYGRVNEGWTDRWTNDFRTMYHINYFRHMSVVLAKNVFGGRPEETSVPG
ncbi:GNAT family N-acetyltransferase [Nitrospira sp. M1]